MVTATLASESHEPVLEPPRVKPGPEPLRPLSLRGRLRPLRPLSLRGRLKPLRGRLKPLRASQSISEQDLFVSPS